MLHVIIGLTTTKVYTYRILLRSLLHGSSFACHVDVAQTGVSLLVLRLTNLPLLLLAQNSRCCMRVLRKQNGCPTTIVAVVVVAMPDVHSQQTTSTKSTII